MGSTFIIKQGDRAESLVAILRSGGTLLDLTDPGLSVQLRLQELFTGTLLLLDADVSDIPTSEVKLDWPVTSTDGVGTYRVEWKVVYSDGRAVTVPNDSYDTLVILPAISADTFDAASETRLRKLRLMIGDANKQTYPTDLPLVNALRDSFPQALLLVRVTGPTLSTDSQTPLKVITPASGVTLSDPQDDYWVTWTAQKFLQSEMVEAARIAASLSSPAGRMNTTEVYRALHVCLGEVQAQLDLLTEELGIGGPEFLGLSVFDVRVNQL